MTDYERLIAFTRLLHDTSEGAAVRGRFFEGKSPGETANVPFAVCTGLGGFSGSGGFSWPSR